MQILAEAEDLPTTANIKTQLISLWTVPIFGAVLLVAFLAFPGFFPPMSPAMTADQVATRARMDPARPSPASTAAGVFNPVRERVLAAFLLL